MWHRRAWEGSRRTARPERPLAARLSCAARDQGIPTLWPAWPRRDLVAVLRFVGLTPVDERCVVFQTMTRRDSLCAVAVALGVRSLFIRRKRAPRAGAVVQLGGEAQGPGPMGTGAHPPRQHFPPEIWCWGHSPSSYEVFTSATDHVRANP